MLNFESMLNNQPPKHRCYETVILNIDGESIIANVLSRGEFLKTFDELETLMKSDDGQYWVLYEEYGVGTEVFWCIPISEVCFVYVPEIGWCLGNETLELEDKLEHFLFEEAYKKELVLQIAHI